MNWFLRTAERIAEDQREKSVRYNNGNTPYAGPNPPDGIRLEQVERLPEDKNLYFYTQDSHFKIYLPRGKERSINPRVRSNGGMPQPISKIREREYEEFLHLSHQWIGDYMATIEVEDTELAVQLKKALDLIRTEWPNQLKDRPLMPSSELRRTISEANDYVRKMGCVAVR